METHGNKYRYSLALTSQFYFCGLPFRLDTTPKCSTNCLYCFAMSRGGRRTSRKLVADPDSLARKLKHSIAHNGQKRDIIDEMLSLKLPVHFGGMSDPFANASVAKITRQLLVHLSNYDYPVVLSTKNPHYLLESETLRTIKRMNYITIQVSFTSLDAEMVRLMEPRVQNTVARLQCVENLGKEGVYVIARLQPLFPGSEAKAAEDLIPKLRSSGCKHVMVEYLKLPVEKNLALTYRMFALLNWDGYSFYHHNGAQLVVTFPQV